jgi:hypothetical protein
VWTVIWLAGMPVMETMRDSAVFADCVGAHTSQRTPAT